MGKKVIGILVGSLRRDSFSKRVGAHLSGLLEERYQIKFFDIASLAMFNEDLEPESNLPQEWRYFRQEVKNVDAVLFITPEYNRSIPPVLKNALDIASRPYTENAWSGKPGAIVSISPGPSGGFGANHHLRQTAVCLGICMMSQPEAYISDVSSVVDEGGVSDEKTQDLLKNFADAFADWVDKLAG